MRQVIIYQQSNKLTSVCNNFVSCWTKLFLQIKQLEIDILMFLHYFDNFISLLSIFDILDNQEALLANLRPSSRAPVECR
jgi:hypothetical protein